MQLCFLNSIIKETGWLTKYDQLNIIFLDTILWHRALLRNEINLSKNCPDLQAILNNSKVLFYHFRLHVPLSLSFSSLLYCEMAPQMAALPHLFICFRTVVVSFPPTCIKTKRSTEQPVTIATSWDFPSFGIKTCSVGKKQRRTWS